MRHRYLLNPIAGYASAPALVAVTTWALYHIQAYVASQQNGNPTRPYGLVYILVIWLLTALAGRGPGLFALILSVLVLDTVLVPPMFSFTMPATRNVIELVLVTIVGTVMIFAQDAHHRTQERHYALLEREALVNKVGVAIRSTLDPERVPEVAADVLGEALNVDRCFFSIYEPSRNFALVGKDWRRSGLASLAGQYRLSDLGIDPGQPFQDGSIHIVSDIDAPGLPSAVVNAVGPLGMRSCIVAPIFSQNRLVASLAVGMDNTVRQWTADEVAIVSSIATLTRSALDLARIHQREAHIASTLQGALQPATPERIPSLDLAPYHKACLDESSVGGDFSDVFPLDKGAYALVVGDVSGKGLAAASQVATIRNMLRFALYTEPDLAQAIGRLNTVLATNDLVSGFATLVVAVFDSGARTVRYVSCGQEPLLLRRTAEGRVERLEPTGPVIGVDEFAEFSANSVELRVGDAFAIFTDGLTECGPSRRELLGIEGMMDLLKNGSNRSAAELMSDVIAGARKHANDVFTDDVCLLIGIVTRH